MEKAFEIYFRDLNPEAQEALLKEFGTNPEEENWETIPLTLLLREEVISLPILAKNHNK